MQCSAKCMHTQTCMQSGLANGNAKIYLIWKFNRFPVPSEDKLILVLVGTHLICKAFMLLPAVGIYTRTLKGQIYCRSTDNYFWNLQEKKF